MAKAKRNIIKLIPEARIVNKIHFIRDQKVMLDFDLAALYEVETKVLNQAVKRNINRFPEDFMFELSREEYNSLRSQIVTFEQGKGKYSKYNPKAFTEQGVAMLSGVINSEKAIAMNIAIMRAFVEIRSITLNNKKLSEQIKILFDRIGEHDVQLNKIYEAIENLLDDKTEKELKENAWKNRKRNWV